MNEDTKYKLRIIGFCVTIIGTFWLLFYVDHIIPEVVQPDGFVGIFQPKPYYYGPTMASIFFGGLFLSGNLISDDEDERFIVSFVTLFIIAIIWIITFFWMWDVGNYWYTIPLKATVFVGAVVGAVLLILGITVLWSDR